MEALQESWPEMVGKQIPIFFFDSSELDQVWGWYGKESLQKLVAHAGFKTDLSAVHASFAVYKDAAEAYERFCKESLEKMLEIVNKNGIESTMKTKEYCKDRFKLTIDHWKLMTEEEIKFIE